MSKDIGIQTLRNLVFILFALMAVPSIGQAGQAILSWDAPTTNADGTPLTDLAGYKIHYGTGTGNYTQTIDVGNVTSYTVTNLTDGLTSYFAVTAYDSSGNESGYSNEVSKTIVDTIAPVLSSMTSGSITSSSATITWTTNEAASSQVEYGTTTAYGSLSALNSTLVTSHSQTLGSLSASTIYHYRVKSSDAAGNVATSGDNTFTTSSAPDTTAPSISGITSSSISSTGVVITWTTNEAASSQVEYGTTTAYGSLSTLNSTLVTSHSRSLSSLQASTTYNYRVKSTDAAGNIATSGNFTFTTSAAPDITAPLISGITSSSISSTGVVITWTTNEAASSQVEYGTTTAYGSLSALNSTLVTSHSRSLSSLQASTTYNYRVKSTDAVGNIATSGNFTFTTSAAADVTPPEDVRNFSAVSGDQQITLSWINPPDTDFVGVRIVFRTDRFPDNISDGELLGDFTGKPNGSVSTIHSGLQNGATYYYSAYSYDGNGNFQTTAHASATPSQATSNNIEPPGSPSGGGCGMILPNDGTPPGPGQSADMLAILGVILLALIKKRLQVCRLTSPNVWR